MANHERFFFPNAISRPLRKLNRFYKHHSCEAHNTFTTKFNNFTHEENCSKLMKQTYNSFPNIF